MAIGVHSNLKIFPDQFYGGFNEVLAQNANVFNESSANSIRLFTDVARGYYFEEAFMSPISSLVRRRDLTSTSADTPTNLSAGSLIAPKRSAGTQLVAQVLSSMFSAGISTSEEEAMGTFSFLVGQQTAQAMLVDMLNTSLTCAVATTGKVAGSSLSIVGATVKTLNYTTALIPGLAKFGDAGQDIRAWVMHSKPFYDLMGSNIAVATDRVAGATIYEGTAGTLGRPVIVTDSPALVKADGVSTGVNSYYTLGLREGGIDVRLSEAPVIYSDLDPAFAAGIALRYKSDWAYNIRVAGYSMTANNTNPTDAQLGNGGNWTQAFSDIKLTAGVRIETA